MLEAFADLALEGTECPSLGSHYLQWVGGKAAQQLPSKGSLRWELTSPSYSFCSYVRLVSLCFECFLLYMPWAVRAQEERNCCSLLSSWEVIYMISKSRNETEQPKARGHVVTARAHNRKPSWKAAYKEKSMTLAPWHISYTQFTTWSQNQSKKEIGSQALILQHSNLQCPTLTPSDFSSAGCSASSQVWNTKKDQNWLKQ